MISEPLVISSLVIEVVPSRREAVAHALAAFKGVEVHASQENKIVVTLEVSSLDASHNVSSKFYNIDGVLSVALVYCNFEEDQTLRRP